MSESGDSKWGTAFFLGFLLGVFVCLGGGGTFVVVWQQRAMLAAERAHRDAARAHEEAEMQRQRAEEAHRVTEAALIKAAEERRLAQGRNLPDAELLPAPKEKNKDGE